MTSVPTAVDDVTCQPRLSHQQDSSCKIELTIRAPRHLFPLSPHTLAIFIDDTHTPGREGVRKLKVTAAEDLENLPEILDLRSYTNHTRDARASPHREHPLDVHTQHTHNTTSPTLGHHMRNIYLEQLYNAGCQLRQGVTDSLLRPFVKTSNGCSASPDRHLD